MNWLPSAYAGVEWHPVTVGLSAARVWRSVGRRTYYLKAAPSGSPGGEPAVEAERFAWLAEHDIPVPEVVDAGERDGTSWIITTAVAGRSLAQSWPDERRGRAVDALAEFTRALHQLPISDCPFDRRLAVSVPEAEAAVRDGEIDLEDLDEPRRGWDGDRLLLQLHRSRPRWEDLAVTHGDLCLPNVMLDPQTCDVTGVIDVGRLGVADRYTDLALATRSLTDTDLNPEYGASYTARFLASYGETAIDFHRIEFYRLLDEFF